MKKVILLTALAALVAGSWYAYSEFTRKPGNAHSEATDFSMTAAELSDAFADETAANEKFLNKYIEVSGTIEEITPNENVTDILLSTNDPLSGINVHLIAEESDKAKSLSPGQEVTLKGKCNGKLSDVELNAGVIIKP